MNFKRKHIQNFRKTASSGFIVFLFAVTLPILLWSCERDIDIKLIEEAPKLVVDATIENGEPPVVLLSKSLNYFSRITPEVLANSIIRGADVFVSDGVNNHKLKEYTTPLGGGFSLHYYSIDSANLSTAFLGEFNKTYSLRIVTEGKEYTASTTIPNITRRIDSIWWKPAPPQAEPEQVVIVVKATDPPGFGDYIRYYTRRNRQPFLSPTNSAFDDLFVDGTTYELPVEPGVNRNATITDEDRFFRRGDTVTLKVSNIDKATYDFWRTMEYSYASVGNPFSTPVKVQSNISGNALGIFGGYASQYRTLIIPK
jgi:hypothetical protein